MSLIMELDQPLIEFGLDFKTHKGEDHTLINTHCQRIAGDPKSSFAVFAVFDGHNGPQAAIYCKERLFNNVMSAIPPNLSEAEWLTELPQALAAGFVKTDNDFQQEEGCSGTTVTFAVINGWTVTVASLGDSRCILDSRIGGVSELSAEHRLEVNAQEKERIIANGGKVEKARAYGVELGPLRSWPGGLSVSRSIGDKDAGPLIVSIPHVKQIKLPNAAARLIIASDGVWDSLSSKKAATCCRKEPAQRAAKRIVKNALHSKGLRDDITCIVVDLMPPDSSPPSPSLLSSGSFHSFRLPRQRREIVPRSASQEFVIEKLFDKGSATYSEWLRQEDEEISPTSGEDAFV